MKKIKWGTLIIAVLIPLAVGGLSSLVSGAGVTYEEMIKPPLSPPSWLFPVVWTILFLLMGISSYLVYVSDAPKSSKSSALTVYAVQLVVNFFWPLFFFKLQAYLLALIWLILLWVLVLIMVIRFYGINKTAGLLQIPYILWLTFAAYLNFGIYLLNR